MRTDKDIITNIKNTLDSFKHTRNQLLRIEEILSEWLNDNKDTQRLL